MIEHSPIFVVYKKERGRKYYLKKFTEYNSVDRIIAEKSRIIPRDCSIEQVGVGKDLEEIYKKKFKIS